jgi:hypothetical protein
MPGLLKIDETLFDNPVHKEAAMVPGLILWLLGVPLGIVVLLWLFGVIG